MPCGLPSALVASGLGDSATGRSNDTTVPVFASAMACWRFWGVTKFSAPS
jgi:hypothetical protein